MPFTHHDIKNPSPIADICMYVFPNAQGFLDCWWPCLKPFTQNKLSLVADRLEFISKLTILQKDIEAKHTYENKDYNSVRTQTFKCNYLNNNFAGVHFDIDALKVYLLTTCIDTIASKVPYKPITSFMDEKNSSFKETNLTFNDLKSWCDEYEETYGLSKAFKEQFLVKMSNPLRKKWLEHFCVCKTIGAQITGGKVGEIEASSIENWKSKTNDQKMKKIADEIYSMRSRFTHEAMRHFSPSLDVRFAIYDHAKHLVQLGTMTLPSLLFATVRDLSEIMMREDYDNPSTRPDCVNEFCNSIGYNALQPFYVPGKDDGWQLCELDSFV